METPKKNEPDAELVITFAKAKTLADNSYSSIKLSEPTARQMELAVDRNPVTSNIKLISAVANVPEEIIRDLTKREMEKAVAYLNSFE